MDGGKIIIKSLELHSSFSGKYRMVYREINLDTIPNTSNHWTATTPKVLPRHFPGRCITRRRERREFGRLPVTTVVYLNRVKIDREGANSSDLGTIHTLLIIEETAARLCWRGRSKTAQLHTGGAIGVVKISQCISKILDTIPYTCLLYTSPSPRD